MTTITDWAPEKESWIAAIDGNARPWDTTAVRGYMSCYDSYKML